MQLPQHAAIVVTDGKKLRLFRNNGDEQQLKLVEMKQPEVHGTAGAGQHQDKDRHETSFEKAVAKWLNHEIATGGIKQVFVIAPPRALGELRLHYGNALKEKLLGEISGEHTQDPVHVLERVLNAV